jgi:hypothetical protein
MPGSSAFIGRTRPEAWITFLSCLSHLGSAVRMLASNRIAPALERKPCGKLKCARTAGPEKTAGSTHRRKESQVEPGGIRGAGRVRAYGHQRNIVAGIAGICETPDVNAVEKVESLGHQINVQALTNSDGFHQTQIHGVERAAEIDSIGNIFQRATRVARRRRRARWQRVPLVDDLIELRAVSHASAERIAPQNWQARRERLPI